MGIVAGAGTTIEKQLQRARSLLTGGENRDIRGDHIVPISPERKMHVGTTAVTLGQEFRKLPSGIFVPAGLAAPLQPIDRIAVYATLEDVVGRRSDPEQVLTLIRAFPRGPLMLMTAQWLGLCRALDADFALIDNRFLAQLPVELSVPLRALLRANERQRVVVPQALMLLAKLGMILSSGVQEDGSMEGLERDFPIVLLALADHLGEREQALAGIPGGAPDNLLLREIASNQHFHARRDPLMLLARWEATWGEPTLVHGSRSVGRIADLYETAKGCAHEDLARVTLALWYLSIHGRPAVMRTDLENLGMPQRRLDAALSVVCGTEGEVRACIAQEYNLGAWEFSAFGRYPVIGFVDAILVLDPDLLLERVFGWLPYFDIEQHLAKAGGRNLLGRFKDQIAMTAESYALDVLRSLAPDLAGSQRVYTETDLKAAFGTKQQTADAVIDYGEVWVVVEVTTHRLTRPAVAGVSTEALIRDLRRLAIEEGAQVAATIDQLRRHETLLTGRPAVTPRRFAPVVLATEGFPVNPMTTSLMHEQLRQAGLLQETDVIPLQIVDLEEIEMVEGLQEVGGPSLANLLVAKPDASFRGASLRDYILAERQLPFVRAKRVRGLFDRAVDRILGDEEADARAS